MYEFIELDRELDLSVKYTEIMRKYELRDWLLIAEN